MSTVLFSACQPEPTTVLHETATVTGVLLDTAHQPVAHSRAVVMSGDRETAYEGETDADGDYVIADVPVELLLAPEATILFVSPTRDLPPLGTVEGDYIHEMPISIDEFIEPALIGAEPQVRARTAYVPLQAPGVPITDELIRTGGELSWHYGDDGMRGELSVTLRIAPNSMVVPPGAQAELTLTPVGYHETPMRIPDGGAGALWTLQPRDVVFDPPAELMIEGERRKLLGTRAGEAVVGEAVEIYGATFTDGWTKFGDGTIAELGDERVVLESVGGIISRGAWGHVFGAPAANAGAELTCYGPNMIPIVCRARRAVNVNPVQVDWSDSVPLDTDGEDLACGGCTNIGAPYAQGSVALQLPYDGADAQIIVENPATGEEVTVELDNVNVNSFRYDSIAVFN